MGEEVQEAAAAGLPGVSQEQVQVQLCQALLRSARFNLAKRYLTGQPHSKAGIPQNLIFMSQR